MLIERVEIRNFKSIKNLDLECRRVNVFIGEPNAGKSNIIEAIVGFPSMLYYRRSDEELRLFVRFDNLSNLFYDNNLEDTVSISFNGKLNFKVLVGFDGQYWYKIEPDLPKYNFYTRSSTDKLKPFKFYRFRPVKFDSRESEYLLPPDGRNLPTVYLTHKRLKSVCKEIFSKFKLKVMIEPESNEIKVVKELEDLLIIYPYSTISDTIQRLVFHLSAVLTNKNSVIAMEEPEAHAFPYYAKYLAELVAMDESNQYFITTHNPYFLLPLIEKTKDIAVFLTYYKDHQTKVKMMSEKDLREILDLGIDVFFNIERFLGE